MPAQVFDAFRPLPPAYYALLTLVLAAYAGVLTGARRLARAPMGQP